MSVGSGTVPSSSKPEVSRRRPLGSQSFGEFPGARRLTSLKEGGVEPEYRRLCPDLVSGAELGTDVQHRLRPVNVNYKSS